MLMTISRSGRLVKKRDPFVSQNPKEFCAPNFGRIIIIIIIIIIIYSLEFFTSALGDSFFTGVWVTASLLKSPGLFSVFWLFSTVL